MKDTNAQTTIQQDGAPVLSFRNAGRAYVHDGRRVAYDVAERTENGERHTFILSKSLDDGKSHIWKCDGDSALRVLAPDVSPLDGFRGKIIGAASGHGRAAEQEQPFTPMDDVLRKHVAAVLRDDGGLPTVGPEIEDEIRRLVTVAHHAIGSACAKHAPLARDVTAESVKKWERADPFIGELFEALAEMLSAAAREALESAGTSFVRVYCATRRVLADLGNLRPTARPRPLGVEYMDKATAASVRRLRGDATDGITVEQYLRVAKYRTDHGLEEPDLFEMLERQEAAAQAIESGEEPKPKTLPNSVLVKSPPSASRKGVPKESLDTTGSRPDAPTRADEEEQRREREPLDALEAVEVERVLRKLARDDLDHAIIDALRHWGHGSQSEIARECGVEPSTVKRRRERLKELAARAAS